MNGYNNMKFIYIYITLRIENTCTRIHQRVSLRTKETLLRFVDTVSAGGVAGQVKNNCRAFDSSTFVGSTIWGTS